MRRARPGTVEWEMALEWRELQLAQAAEAEEKEDPSVLSSGGVFARVLVPAPVPLFCVCLLNLDKTHA